MKSAAIMQPYLFPYIGYFQLLAAAEVFVIYDNIQFTKKGWIHRNRILVNGSDSYISLPLKKDSSTLDVKDRYLADLFVQEKEKLLSRIKETYRKAPHFKDVYPIIEECFNFYNTNLFEFVFNSFKQTLRYLNIENKICISSSIDIDHSLMSADKVIAICRYMDADVYINPIGGVELYSREQFFSMGITLKFLKSIPSPYKQFDHPFVPNLSIIDVMMFNSVKEIREMLGRYELV